MRAGVDHLHVRCHAGAGRTAEALALRTRLERAARVHLPGALRGTLERRGAHVYVDRVDVRLDFDPREYDDVTVAALWARAVGDALDGLATREDGMRVFADERAYAAAAVDELLERGALSWVFGELGCGAGAVPLAALLDAIASAYGAARVRELLVGGGTRERASRVYTRLSEPERARVLERLAGTAVLHSTVAVRGAADPRCTPGPPHGTTPSRALGRQDDASVPIAARRWPDDEAACRAWCVALTGAAPPATVRGPASRPRPTPTPTPPASETAEAGTPPRAAHAPDPAVRGARAAKPRAEAPGEREASRTPSGTPSAADGLVARDAWWTIGGGLVLLWPWLAELLRSPLPPVRGLPAVPPERAARLWALAGLLGENRGPFLADPLVRLLAGDDFARPRPPGDARGEPVPGAARVLRAFAATLRGFGGASDAYLREHLLLRGALIEVVEPDVMRVRLEPLPLDVLLDLLPYPLGPFRLDDTPLIVVERRARWA